MKKLLSVLAFVSIFCSSNAQENDRVFKPFRVDVNIGDAIPSGSGSSQGVSFGIEPKYALNDQMQIGLRMEAALMVRGVLDANAASGNVTGNGSYTATGDYYFTTNKFRPYAGIGLGICKTASVAFEVKDPNQGDFQMAIGSETKFESLIRAGFEYGHGRFALEYNIIPKSTFNSDQNTSITVKNSYFGIKLGIAIGGGRLNK